MISTVVRMETVCSLQNRGIDTWWGIQRVRALEISKTADSTRLFHRPGSWGLGTARGQVRFGMDSPVSPHLPVPFAYRSTQEVDRQSWEKSAGPPLNCSEVDLVGTVPHGALALYQSSLLSRAEMRTRQASQLVNHFIDRVHSCKSSVCYLPKTNLLLQN